MPKAPLQLVEAMFLQALLCRTLRHYTGLPGLGIRGFQVFWSDEIEVHLGAHDIIESSALSTLAAMQNEELWGGRALKLHREHPQVKVA